MPKTEKHIFRRSIDELDWHLLEIIRAICRDKYIQMNVFRIEGIRVLLPRSKMDVKRAKTIAEYGYPAVAPYMGELTGWLQDPNWPISKVVARFFIDIGVPIVPEIRRVLQTTGGTWKRNVLTVVSHCSTEVVELLKPELIRIVTQPTTDETAEDVVSIAKELLQNLK